jgi:flagellar motor switch protein FliG
MNNENKIFINGKSQAISMLKLLTREERNRILSQIKIKNPSLADDLNNNCVSFNDIEHLSDNSIKNLLERVQPQVIGLAIKNSSVDFQKRILKIAQRDFAEEAYQILRTPLGSEQVRLIGRAQNKILNHLSNHLKI